MLQISSEMLYNASLFSPASAEGNFFTNLHSSHGEKFQDNIESQHALGTMSIPCGKSDV